MCIKTKTFGFFLNESRINWLLAFHIPGNTLTWPSISYWRAIYWASWMHWRRIILESKETIVHCCLTYLCLSLHPFVPLEHTFLLFPSFPFPCKLSIKMEEWSGGGPVGGLDFSISMRCRQSLSLFYLCLLLIEISISRPLNVYDYEYFIHGSSYIFLYMMVLYML